MTGRTMEKEVRDSIIGIIEEALLVARDQIRPESRLFSDLKAESIDVVDIRFRLEHAFGFKIDKNAMMRSLGEDLSPAEIDRLFTVGWIVKYVLEQLKIADEAV